MRRFFLYRFTVISVLLVLLSVLCVAFAGCDAETPPAETSGEVSDGAPESDAPPVEIKVSELSQYRIIYRENGGEDELEQVLALQSALLNAYGVSLEAREDMIREGTSFVESECEIVVGRCDRETAVEFCRGLRADDYGYCVSGKKIVIAGATADATADAVRLFIRDVVGKDAETLLSSEDAVTVRGEYDVPPVFLGGTELSAYSIVYPKGDERLSAAADYLADLFRVSFGYFPDVRDDGEAEYEHEILLGTTSRGVPSESLADNEYLISMLGDSVVLTGNSATLVYRAVDGLVDRITEGLSANAERIDLSLDQPIRTVCDTASLRVMSFNIRCNEFTEDRIALVFRMIDVYAPDTIGFQEATVAWMNRLKSYLGDSYGCVGVGRNSDHSGEASPVFYLKSKFELIESGTRWMTATPDVAGSKIEESSLPRVYSYAVLKVIENGQTFVHVNTHLEHTSEEAREIQAGYLVEFLETYRVTGAAYIVTGDFNCTRGAGSYNVMINAGLEDSLYIADEALPGVTYHGYGKTEKVIDHIFVSGSVDVMYYKACTETFTDEDGKVAYPSDHNPVIIDCEIK